MKILVTGASGYIGKILTKKLLFMGYKVIPTDIISTGFNEEVICDLTKDDIHELPEVDIVFHLAAHKSVPESVKNPTKYLENVLMTHNIVKRYPNAHIIFSSTAAVYKNKKLPHKETDILSPESPYGSGKVACEYIVQHNPKHTILRYFNVIGYYKGAKRSTNVLDILSSCRDEGKTFYITGNDFDTTDGTGIRDYIDLNDVVEAHIKCLKKVYGIYNIGSGKGISVKEMIEAYTNKFKLNYEYTNRRKGDVAISVANCEKFEDKTGWKPKISFEESLESYINIKKT